MPSEISDRQLQQMAESIGLATTKSAYMIRLLQRLRAWRADAGEDLPAGEAIWAQRFALGLERQVTIELQRSLKTSPRSPSADHWAHTPGSV
jgi:hypothetical protein